MAFCQHCGSLLEADAAYCTKCGKAVGPIASTDDNAALRWLIPVGRSGWAIAAGYAGLLAVFPIVGQLAIVFGILAIRDIKKHPGRHGLGRAWFGIVAGALATLVWLVLLVVSHNKAFA